MSTPKVLRQITSPQVDHLIYDDGSVITDGVPNTNAQVVIKNGEIYADFTGDGNLDMAPPPVPFDMTEEGEPIYDEDTVISTITEANALPEKFTAEEQNVISEDT